MKNIFSRIVSLLLVPCLLADPALAAALSQDVPITEQQIHLRGFHQHYLRFNEQALSDAAQQVRSPIFFTKIRTDESGIARKAGTRSAGPFSLSGLGRLGVPLAVGFSLTLGAGLLAAQGRAPAVKFTLSSFDWTVRAGLIGGLVIMLAGVGYQIYTWRRNPERYGKDAIEQKKRKQLHYGFGMLVSLFGVIPAIWALIKIIERVREPALRAQHRLPPELGNAIASPQTLEFFGRMLFFLGIIAASLGFGAAATGLRQGWRIMARSPLSTDQWILDKQTRYKILLDDHIPAKEIAKLRTAALEQNLSDEQIQSALKRRLTPDEKRYLQTVREVHARTTSDILVGAGILVGFCGTMLMLIAPILILHLPPGVPFIKSVLTVAGLISAAALLQPPKDENPLIKAKWLRWTAAAVILLILAQLWFGIFHASASPVDHYKRLSGERRSA